MSLLSAAAADEDGDTINELRAENAQLRASLLAMHDTLEMTTRAGSAHARAAEGLRATVLAWALRAEEAEDMLEAIGAGGVGPLMPSNHCEQHLDMVPAGWKLVPVVPTTKMIDAARSRSSFPCGVYYAMLAAAPQPPTAEDSSVVVQPQGEQKPAGEAGPMPFAKGFTMACFPASDVPVGTKLYTAPQPKREPRTDREITDQTEELAGLLMRAFHQREKADSLSTFRDSLDSRARHCWLLACQIQEMLTDTDPENAASELENGIGGEA